MFSGTIKLKVAKIEGFLCDLSSVFVASTGPGRHIKWIRVAS
jgi:hypothetical protein